MSEEMTEGTQPDQTPVEPSEAVSGENVDTTETVEKTTTESSESDQTHDTLDKGNESVETKESADMSDRERSAVRKMHEATQEGAKYKKEADAFQELLNHPEFNEFLQWQKDKKNPSQPSQEVPQVELTEEELLAAQTDPSKYDSLMRNKFQSLIEPLAKQVMDRLSNMERDNAISKQERNLDAFAEKHPDFYSIDPRIMKASIAETRGQGIEAAYNMAKSLDSKYLDKAQSSIQKKVQQKKQASAASPSKPMEPKIVYAATQSEADHIAFENAKLGKRVDVRVKK